MVAVSVVIPAWSAESFIHRAIDSVRTQTLSDIEAWVIDDASPDATLSAARRAAGGDPRIHLGALPQRRGAAAARNEGIRKAQGRYIAVLDADDWMVPDRLRTMVDHAERLGADILADRYVRVFDVDRPLKRRASTSPQVTEIGLAAYVRANLPSTGARAMGYLKPIFRRDFVQAHAITQDEDVPIMEDFVFVAEALACGARFFLTRDEGYFYWTRTGSISRTPTPADIAKGLAGDERFRARYADRLTKPDIAALDARANGLRDLHLYLTCKDAALRGRPLAALAVLQRPAALMFLGHMLRYHAGRVTRRFQAHAR